MRSKIHVIERRALLLLNVVVWIDAGVAVDMFGFWWIQIGIGEGYLRPSASCDWHVVVDESWSTILNATPCSKYGEFRLWQQFCFFRSLLRCTLKVNPSASCLFKHMIYFDINNLKIQWVQIFLKIHLNCWIEVSEKSILQPSAKFFSYQGTHCDSNGNNKISQA